MSKPILWRFWLELFSDSLLLKNLIILFWDLLIIWRDLLFRDCCFLFSLQIIFIQQVLHLLVLVFHHLFSNGTIWLLIILFFIILYTIILAFFSRRTQTCLLLMLIIFFLVMMILHSSAIGLTYLLMVVCCSKASNFRWSAPRYWIAILKGVSAWATRRVFLFVVWVIISYLFVLFDPRVVMINSRLFLLMEGCHRASISWFLYAVMAALELLFRFVPHIETTIRLNQFLLSHPLSLALVIFRLPQVKISFRNMVVTVHVIFALTGISVCFCYFLCWAAVLELKLSFLAEITISHPSHTSHTRMWKSTFLFILLTAYVITPPCLRWIVIAFNHLFRFPPAIDPFKLFWSLLRAYSRVIFHILAASILLWLVLQ